MNTYKTELKIDTKDEEFAVLTVTDESGNFGRWLMQKSKENYYIVSFMKGKIGQTEFRGAEEDKTLFVKNGRGKAPKGTMEQMKEIRTEAYKYYDEY